MQIENHGFANIVQWSELQPGSVVRLVSGSRISDDEDIYLVIRVEKESDGDEDEIDPVALANFTDGHVRTSVAPDWKIQDITATVKLSIS